ncbi:MAG: hypothetical protein CW342_00090 [Thermoactinomycetaceae bacterium]|nr:hypothetical protein [Bacillota bacterium]MBO2531290.1 hypothetical protein [Thermoactinomycetaceae bacterium]
MVRSPEVAAEIGKAVIPSFRLCPGLNGGLPHLPQPGRFRSIAVFSCPDPAGNFIAKEGRLCSLQVENLT